MSLNNVIQMITEKDNQETYLLNSGADIRHHSTYPSSDITACSIYGTMQTVVKIKDKCSIVIPSMNKKKTRQILGEPQDNG